MNKLKRAIWLLAVLALLCAVSIFSASAAIFTDETGGGRADSVYVAGNPDAYPLEYYDAEAGVYRGLFPELLRAVSEATGLDFTYISAGEEDLRESLCKNRQVELATAVTESSFKGASELLPVLTVEENGQTVRYCLAITDVLSPEKKAVIVRAFSELTEAEKVGALVRAAQEAPSASRAPLLLLVGLAVAVLLAALLLLRALRKKRAAARLERMIDKSTGLGNGDYYVYAFHDLISPQSKSLYALAYFALDTATFEARKSGISVRELDKYAAGRFRHYAAAAEYPVCIDEGVFAFLFQAENAATAERRVAETLNGVNESLAEFVSGEPLLRAGYCRLYDHMDADAEAALYHAKQGYLYAAANHLPYQIGSKALTDERKKADALAAQIDDALKNGEFKVYLQLILDCQTGAFCGAEVLSRWQNIEFGLLRPHEYIPLLNKTGKIVAHDYAVFESACRQLAAWSQPPFDRLFLTCNFTRLSVSRPDFADRLTAIARSYPISPARLVIEMTEDTLSVNSKTVSENIRRLSAFGFQVALDDMGAGFSSLADIYDNEFDIVKIERDFIATCTTDRRRQMLSDIIALVHNAGARVICEGIETAEQDALLRSIHCDMMQGFYHSRVLPLSECERFLRTKL